MKDGKQEGRIFRAYIREHIRAVILYGMAVLILYGLAALYDYREVFRNMSYGVVLIVFFGAVYGVRDYLRYRGKCLALRETLERSGERMAHLPEPDSYMECLYREITDVIETEERDALSEYDAKKQDMADYYTMWTHQIKTPIAALRLLLQGEKQQLEELFKIEQYAEMALHYARLDSISSDLLFQTQDVAAILRAAVRKYSILFIGSGLSFALEEFSLHEVTDEKWLSFVFEQILSNALKYTQDGAIQIYGLDRQGEKTHGEAAFIVIEDSGIGIREEDLPRIFERGFTGHNGRMDKRSTGIGLYLCRQILDRLSHTIRVESRMGQGTKVIVGFAREDWGEGAPPSDTKNRNVTGM